MPALLQTQLHIFEAAVQYHCYIEIEVS